MRDPRVWLFRIIALAAIIFAAGHSGGFLNTQEGALGRYGWGVFGALVAGLALWGGIYVYVAYDQRSGLLVAIVAVVADVVMGYGWFLKSATIAPFVLALWPPLLALLAGVIEGGLSRSVRAEQQAEDARAAELERELALKRLQGEQRLAAQRLKLEAQTSAPQPSANTEPASQPEQSVNSLLTASNGNFTVSQLVEASGMSRGWVHSYLGREGWSYDNGVWHKNGKGGAT